MTGVGVAGCQIYSAMCAITALEMVQVKGNGLIL